MKEYEIEVMHVPTGQCLTLRMEFEDEYTIDEVIDYIGNDLIISASEV